MTPSNPAAPSPDALKAAVRRHWEEEPCNTRYSGATQRQQYFAELTASRYALEPNIPKLARFDQARGKRVLEIGVGYGVDFVNWVKGGAVATGVDFTQAAIDLTREFLDLQGLSRSGYPLMRADAERLPIPDGIFDLVYSYGVLHHTPDTPRAFREAARVLKPGGELRAMIYHVPSWTAFNLWLYHALFQLKPFRTFKQVVFDTVESPGTKAYSVAEAEALLRQAGLEPVSVKLRLDCGDLLSGKLSNKYAHNPFIRLAVALYPRPLIRLIGNRFGNTMELIGTKPHSCAG